MSFSALSVSLTTKVTKARGVRALNLTLSLLRLILMAISARILITCNRGLMLTLGVLAVDQGQELFDFVDLLGLYEKIHED